MTCKNCVHYELCFDFTHLKYSKNLPDNREDVCDHFKNKTDFIEVKRGRWETRNFIIFDSEKVGYRCSECKTTWDTEMNYCPNCGADMRKEGATDG